MAITEKIKSLIDEHISDVEKLKSSIAKIAPIARIITESIQSGGKILFMGNGGSAADAQHLAAEFVGRFQLERKGFPAIALTTDSSIITSISNDYGYEKVFYRQIQALCKKEDVVVGISTSGNSANIIQAFDAANSLGASTVGFTGAERAAMDEKVRFCLKVPSTHTARIQEMHILCGHIICELVEQALTENVKTN